MVQDNVAHAHTKGARTSDLVLDEWLRHPVFRGWDRDEPLQYTGLLDSNTGLTGADLVASGISAVDVCAYADMHVPGSAPRCDFTRQDDLHAQFLFARLCAMHGHYPMLGLRDALGYSFLASQVASSGGDNPVLELIAGWAVIGLASHGWALTAAGIMPAEAAAHPVPDEDTLQAMLALRPVVLPHG